MNLIEAVILGLIQGLTEFIPVSSSGHLVVVQSFFKNFSQPGVLFDSILHLGTLTAVLYYFRKRFKEIITNIRLLLLIVVASVPTGIIGFAFKDTFEKMFSNVQLVGAAFIVTGIMLFFADKKKSGIKNTCGTSYLDVIIIGIVQGIAIIPGISRSGATLTAGIYRKLDKKFAMEFSFLLSIPAILGAVVLQSRHVTRADAGSMDFAPYVFGFFAAAIVGYFTIKVLLNFLLKQKMYIFSIYLWIIGSLILILGSGAGGQNISKETNLVQYKLHYYVAVTGHPDYLDIDGKEIPLVINIEMSDKNAVESFMALKWNILDANSDGKIVIVGSFGDKNLPYYTGRANGEQEQTAGFILKHWYLKPPYYYRKEKIVNGKPDLMGVIEETRNSNFTKDDFKGQKVVTPEIYNKELSSFITRKP